MNIKRIIIIGLSLSLAALIALAFLRIKDKNDFRQKVVLAQEINKVLRSLMVDLSQVRGNAIMDVPADGIWHGHIAFIRGSQGVLGYSVRDGHLFREANAKESLIADDIGSLRVRHQRDTPDILEFQIVARKDVSLISYLKIRVRG